MYCYRIIKCIICQTHRGWAVRPTPDYRIRVRYLYPFNRCSPPAVGLCVRRRRDVSSAHIAASRMPFITKFYCNIVSRPRYLHHNGSKIALLKIGCNFWILKIGMTNSQPFWCGRALRLRVAASSTRWRAAAKERDRDIEKVVTFRRLQ